MAVVKKGLYHFLIQPQRNTMALHFTKMHGLGNDFMVIDGVNQTVTLTPADIRMLSQREIGVGFDQCLIIEPSHTPNIDFFYRIYNANGESVGQCGNGARCIARFIEHYQLSSKQQLNVATTTTTLTLHLNMDKTVTVDMGKPNLMPELIPLAVEKIADAYALMIRGTPLLIHALSIGNPHAIVLVDDLDNTPVAEFGREICEHALFPEQANVSFLNIHTPHHIALRVFERGCGETRACGSAAVAAVAAGQLFHHLDNTVYVDLPGGSLTVEWPDRSGSIFLTGPATFSYEGQLISNDDVTTSTAQDVPK